MPEQQAELLHFMERRLMEEGGCDRDFLEYLPKSELLELYNKKFGNK